MSTTTCYAPPPAPPRAGGERPCHPRPGPTPRRAHAAQRPLTRGPLCLASLEAPYDGGVRKQNQVADDVLMERVVGRDQEAFAELYDRWAGRLLALVVQVLVDHSQSEEVLQEVFLEVWRRAESFDPDKGSLRAWLVTLARRRAVDRVRSSQAARDRDQRWSAAMPEVDLTVQSVEDNLEAEELRQALAAVGEPHRSTLVLAYFTGLTHAQIATRTGVPLGTVKTRVRDGLIKLRTHLGVSS